MSYATQVGYVVNEGAIFVIPSGSENKVMILECRFETVNGVNTWVTRTRDPSYVPVLNASGGDQFPYAQDACTIEGYENDQLVDLVGTDTYKLPNFGAHNYAGSYQNVGSDWLSVSFRAPSVIRNKTEWNEHNGNPGTPKGTGTTGTGTDPLAKAPTPKTTTTNWLLYGGIAVIVVLLIVLLRGNNSKRRSR